MFTLNVYILSMVISAAVTFLFSPFRKAMFGRPPGSIRIVSPSKPAILPRSNRTTRTEREDSVEGRRTAVEGDASKENGQIPIHKESIGISVSELVKSNVPSFQKGYKPSWWLSNGHLQTAYCVIGNFTRIHKVTYVRQLLRLPDGGTVSVDTSPPNHTSLPPTAPTVVIAHGLTGGSHESYVRNVVEWVVKPRAEGGLGGRAVVSNYRGCAGTKITSPQFYSAGYTGDYHTVVSYVHSQFPASPLVGAGFSLGASVLARYMGEEGERCALTGGVVLGCPWDIPSMSHTLETGWISQRIYSSAMCKNLMRVVLGASHSEGNKSPITLAAASTSTSTSTSTHTSRHSSTVSSGTSTPNYSTSVTSTGSDIDIPILFPYHNENIPIDQVIAHFVEQKKGNLRLRDFDDYVTCLYGGLRKDQSEKGAFPFKDADAYYEWASSKPLIKNVKRPLLGVNAFDDPVIDGGSLPVEEIESSSHVVLAITPGGGHLGWFDGPFFSFGSNSFGSESYSQHRWVINPISEYITALLGKTDESRVPPRRAIEQGEDGWTWVKGSEEDTYGRVGWKVVESGEMVEGVEDESGVLQGL